MISVGDNEWKFKYIPTAAKFKALPPAVDPTLRNWMAGSVQNHKWVWSVEHCSNGCVGCVFGVKEDFIMTVLHMNTHSSNLDNYKNGSSQKTSSVG